MRVKSQNIKKLTLVVSLLIVAALAAIGVWHFNYRDNGQETFTQITQQEQAAGAVVSQDGKTVSYSGVENQSALSLLKEYMGVQTDEYPGLGEYVVSINGVKSNSSENFWAFYVNGEQATIGAGDYITTTTDYIEWKLEDVEAYQE